VEKTAGEGPDYLGVALYYYTYSTFTGKPTLYLEDIFVPEEYRGRGIGTGLLVELAKIAVEKGCARIDWIVLDWNKPSWDFYKNLGAFPMEDWTVFRMLPPEIKKLAEKKL
jgi:GNAT superfamily N-acetyltransferase